VVNNGENLVNIVKERPPKALEMVEGDKLSSDSPSSGQGLSIYMRIVGTWNLPKGTQ
jgi:hypothetical protein